MTPAPILKPKDYASSQEVRWCPGCGDYAILKAVQRTLADLRADPDATVFVSGIGCAARFPYYLATYGFHTIHGRAAAIAGGVKAANPDLDVWVVSGDGDSLSIGGNHLLHLLRRDPNLTYLLFNNEIYGLTKGQTSPTSRPGTRSPTTPDGSVDRPVRALPFALGAGARFVARCADIAQPHLVATLKAAHAHVGTAFVEILQNCIVYNDAVFAEVTGKKVAADVQLHVEHGQPLVFGKDRDRGIVFNAKTFSVEVVELSEDVSEADVLVHDQTNAALAGLLARMEGPEFPVAMGVLYCAPDRPAEPAHAPLCGEAVLANLNVLLRAGHTWRAA